MRDFHQECDDLHYARETEISFADCGPQRKMRVGAMLSRMAVYAGYDYDARGLTYDVLLGRQEVFLLSRLALHIHRCPSAGEVLLGSTREDGAKGAHFQRVFTFRDGQGELCWSARTDWILVDPESRKILRPSNFTLRPMRPCGVEVDCPEPKKLRLPEGAAELGERIVRWSDLDGNGHLFSGVYGDVIWDALPAELQNQTPKYFYLNYQHEATLGEPLRLLGLQEGSSFHMEGVGPDGPCFTALAEF